MEHLNTEALARLVEHPPRPDEAKHLAICEICQGELDVLRRQTDALGSLPEILPPMGDWEVLEARLRSEGLMRDPGLPSRVGLAHTPGWMRAAAAVVLFLSGAALGAGFRGDGAGSAALGPDGGAAQYASVEDAAQAVRQAEERYVNALSAYRSLLGSEGGEDALADASSRYAALEVLLAAGQAALRQAPADPFLNGLYASTLAEREATLHRISTQQENWF